jgi:hypothetical protein
MNIFEKFSKDQKECFMKYIRKEYRDRRESKVPITWAEYCEMRMNLYEFQYIYFLLDDEALVRVTLYHLKNSSHGHNPITEDSCTLHEGTYDGSIEQLLVPLLLKRFAEKSGFELPKTPVFK